MFAQPTDTTTHDLGFHFSLAGGVNTLRLGSTSIYFDAGYRRDEMMYTLSFSGHMTEWELFGSPGLVISELGGMIGKIHFSDCLYWSYSGGAAFDEVERRIGSGGGLFSGNQHTTCFGAAAIGELQAGITVGHVVSLCACLYGSLNTTQPFLAGMVMVQLVYL